jgi:uncharacterized protein (DUF697 family)
VAKNYHLNVMIDPELERALRAHAEAAGMELSGAVRDLLRHALGVVSSSRDAGWAEGYNAAYGKVQRAINQALTDVKPEAA